VGLVIGDFEACYRVCQARDPRFDGWFFVGVRSTGIYCRPSCPAITPKRANVEFHPSAASAQRAGFRACKRCRPDASPGSPEWNRRADLVARAMRLIADGVVDREGVPGLAAHLGYGVRQLERALRAELGAGPLAIARAQRAQTARVLIESTDLDFTSLAFAAGFASIRQFNDTVRSVFASTPTDLRQRARGRLGSPDPEGHVLQLRLGHRLPHDPLGVFEHLGRTAVPGVEQLGADGTAYSRTLHLPHGSGVVELVVHHDHVRARLELSDLRDLPAAVTRCRWLCDLDADPVAVDGHLATDPFLRPVVERHPGRRVPRTPDGAELAVRAVLGQQVSTSAAQSHAARLVQALGKPLDRPRDGLTHHFPSSAAIADAPDAVLALPATRRNTVREIARRLDSGELVLDPGADRHAIEAALLDLRGIGPWTASTILMRSLGDPDVFLPNDLGVRRAASALGLPTEPRALSDHSARWRPWRSYAVQYLWSSLGEQAPLVRAIRPRRKP
jgi:AraC family transcriptional regulator, regulatory protein of adaptative response / DNA-3-methyladenine glycosylase II